MGEVLRALQEEHRATNGAASVTRVGAQANVPHDRLLGYLDELAAAGLITRGRPPQITEAGREFLRRYADLKDVLDRYGLG